MKRSETFPKLDLAWFKTMFDLLDGVERLRRAALFALPLRRRCRQKEWRQAMIERGLETDFATAAQQELATIGRPAEATDDVRDQRDRPWTSIGNDDSRDRQGTEIGICTVRD
jgi:hypothetical protein